MAEKASSLGRAGDALFRGIMYILYGKRAGETKAEKAARLGLMVIFLVALILISSMVKRAIFPSRPKPRHKPRPPTPKGMASPIRRPIEQGVRPSRPGVP
ncbi:hypothetical protein KAU86_05700 [bacterium]|nr:hypothetical protein [bacterium]MCK4437420.1 hypothetical protein [bacterium]